MSSCRLSSLLRVLVGLFLLLAPALPCRADDEDLAYLQRVTTTYRALEDGRIELTVDNANNRPPTMAQARMAVTAMLATPPDCSVLFETAELEWGIWWAEGFEGPHDRDTSGTLGLAPEVLARAMAAPLGEFRGVGANQVRVSLTTIVSAPPPDFRRGTAVLRRGVFVGRIAGRTADEPATPDFAAQRDPYLLEMAPLLFLNHEQVPAMFREPRLVADTRITEWNAMLADAATRAPLAFFEVRRAGWLRLDGTALRAVGLDPEAYPLDRLRLFAGFTELPRHVDTRAGATLATGAVVSVYVDRPDSERQPWTPVWLLNVDEGKMRTPPLEMRAADYSATESEDRAALGASTTVTVFEPRAYDPKQTFDTIAGRWNLGRAGVEEFVEASFDAPTPDSSRAGSLTVVLHTQGPPLPTRARVYLNGTRLGDDQPVRGGEPTTITLPIEAGRLRAGANTLAVLHVVPAGTAASAEALSFVRGEVSVPLVAGTLPADRRVMVVDLGEDGEESEPRTARPASGRVAFVDASTSATAPLLAEVTWPREPRVVALDERLEADVPATTATLALSYSAGVGALPPLRRVEWRDWLRPAEGADTLVIAPELFADEAREYAAWRGSPDNRVVVVPVDDVMAFFGAGAYTDTAILHLLRHAAHDWPGRRVARVVLMGEASDQWFDPAAAERPDMAPNLVPVFGASMPRINDPLYDIRGDDGYAQLIGSGLADVAVGRLPAETKDEMRALLDRLNAYEDTPPIGDWPLRHLLVTDDEPEFARVAERIVAHSVAPRAEPVRLYQQLFDYQDYFRIFLRKRSIDAHEAVMREWNRGALSATYIGHGGPNIWGEERLLHLRDIPQLDDGGRRPILAAGSCDTAWVDYPQQPVRHSLAERLLLGNKGGAIGVFAPLASASPFEHDYILRPFLASLVDERVADLGSATLLARLAYGRDRALTVLPSQYILLGDPHLKIARPTGGLDVRIDTPNAAMGFEGELAIAATTLRPLPSAGIVRAALVAPDGRDVATMERPLAEALDTSGTLRLALIAPRLQPGHWSVRVRVEDGDKALVASGSTTLAIAPPKVTLTWKTTPEGVTSLRVGERMRVVLEVKHDGAPGTSDINVTVSRPASEGGNAPDTPILVRAGRGHRASFDVVAEEGMLVFDATARLVGAGRDEVILEQSQRAWPVVADPVRAPLSVAPALASVVVTGEPDTSLLTIPLAHGGEQPLTNIVARLIEEAVEPPREYSQKVRVHRLAPGERTDVAFALPGRYPPGRKPFRLVIDARVGDDGVTTTTQSLYFRAPMPALPDLELVPGSLVVSNPTPALATHTVHLRAAVRNNGPGSVSDVPVAIYIDAPGDPRALATSNTRQATATIAHLDAGETAEVDLRWDPHPSVGLGARVFAVVNNDGHIAETNRENNTASLAVAFRPLPNLAITPDDVRVSPAVVRPGDDVTLSITFRNTTDDDFTRPLVVRAGVSGPGAPEAPVAREVVPGLEANAEKSFTWTWKADGKRSVFAISINDEREFGEARNDDNKASGSFEYVLPVSADPAAPAWRFAMAGEVGPRQHLFVAPDGALEITSRPTDFTRLTFDNSVVEGAPLPIHGQGATDRDGRMALADGALYWTPDEQPENVRLRIPMPTDDLTTVYDVYLDHLGAAFRQIDYANAYQWRAESNLDWSFSTDRDKKPEAILGHSFVGRLDTIDDVLELEIGPTGEASWNTILAVRVAPFEGAYTSPLLELGEGGLPAARMVEDAVRPLGTAILYQTRRGAGTPESPRWTPWTPLEPGQSLPSDPEARLLQWRCRLLSTGAVSPRLAELRFELPPSSPTPP